MLRPLAKLPENYIKDIPRKTRRLFTAEQKVLIVMEALRADVFGRKAAVNIRSTNHNFTNGIGVSGSGRQR
jgi:hypothetical protein